MLNQQQSLSAKSLQYFSFDNHSLQTYEVDGQVWFGAQDVCGALGLDNASRATMRLDGDEKGITTGNTPGGTQEILIVNESGLYSLILTSRKPAAKRFKRWITHEVLPAIRRTGTYTVQPPLPLPGPTENVSLTELVGERIIVRVGEAGNNRVSFTRIPWSAVVVDPHDPKSLDVFVNQMLNHQDFAALMQVAFARVMNLPQLKASN